jgi:hypothetical protein
VTVYQLLHGCSPFDVSKLFSWQSMHKYVWWGQGFKLFLYLCRMNFLHFHIQEHVNVQIVKHIKKSYHYNLMLNSSIHFTSSHLYFIRSIFVTIIILC